MVFLHPLPDPIVILFPFCLVLSGHLLFVSAYLSLANHLWSCCQGLDSSHQRRDPHHDSLSGSGLSGRECRKRLLTLALTLLHPLSTLSLKDEDDGSSRPPSLPNPSPYLEDEDDEDDRLVRARMRRERPMVMISVLFIFLILLRFCLPGFLLRPFLSLFIFVPYFSSSAFLIFRHTKNLLLSFFHASRLFVSVLFVMFFLSRLVLFPFFSFVSRMINPFWVSLCTTCRIDRCWSSFVLLSKSHLLSKPKTLPLIISVQQSEKSGKEEDKDRKVEKE